MDKLWTILEANPVLAMVLGFALAVLAMILFRAEIKAWIKKKYNLIDRPTAETKLDAHFTGETVREITERLFK